ncbi:hypothetical protein DDZ13_14035 [Coraliomargarita sinensis]|uniref:Methane oxygenase PmoA n=2 Tax=Coraliomargarita sinensis TaxID=2174842 RepID=A0A317ZFU0_9BACT|nr:hypothetical protein DDZ13_14035 [Coraliomargarita sinensis]
MKCVISKSFRATIALFLAHALEAEIAVLQNGQQLRVEIDGELFTEYRTERHVPCLYPLLSPDGTHLTRRYPFAENIVGEASDHPHHIGFWFAHGDVNGYDFWHGRNGERITTSRVQHGSVDKGPEGSRVRFSADLDWIAGRKKLLTERRVYTIIEKGSDRIIDVTCHLKATETELVFGDTKEGSFALRLTPTLRLKGEVARGAITNSEGAQGRDAWGQRARWVAYHGPDSAGTATVVAIFDHPENLRHPTWWHARDYGLLTANPFGPKAFGDDTFTNKGDFILKESETLTLRYRLVLHQGNLHSAELNERWNEFTRNRPGQSDQVQVENNSAP